MNGPELQGEAWQRLRDAMKSVMPELTDEKIATMVRAQLLTKPPREENTARPTDHFDKGTWLEPDQVPAALRLPEWAHQRALEMFEEQEARERVTGERKRQYNEVVFKALLREARARMRADGLNVPDDDQI